MFRDADASVFQNWAVLETRGWFYINPNVDSWNNSKLETKKKKKQKLLAKVRPSVGIEYFLTQFVSFLIASINMIIVFIIIVPH